MANAAEDDRNSRISPGRIIEGVIIALLCAAGAYFWNLATELEEELKEMEKIATWVGYDPEKNPISTEIVGLKDEFSKNRDRTDQLWATYLEAINGTATRQNPDNLNADKEIGVYLNSTQLASRFSAMTNLLIENTSSGLESLIPVIGSYRFPNEYGDAQIMLTIPASEALHWGPKATRMAVRIGPNIPVN